MKKTFQEALLERVATSKSDAASSGKPTMKAVAEGSGVSYEQLKKVRQRGGSTNIDDALRVANFFGLTLEEFMDDPTAIVRSEIDALYTQLSDGERAYLKGVADGLRARDSTEREQPVKENPATKPVHP